jgi:hypothetical protein
VSKVRSNKIAAEKIAKIFAAQNEGVSAEVREKRLLALEQIANSIRARRAKPEESHSTGPNPARSRVHA